MQVERTKERIHDSAVYLTKQYPKLCTLNTSKKSGFTEVRMYDKRDNKPNLVLNKDGSINKSESNTSSQTTKQTKKKKGNRNRNRKKSNK